MASVNMIKIGKSKFLFGGARYIYIYFFALTFKNKEMVIVP